MALLTLVCEKLFELVNRLISSITKLKMTVSSAEGGESREAALKPSKIESVSLLATGVSAEKPDTRVGECCLSATSGQ